MANQKTQSEKLNPFKATNPLLDAAANQKQSVDPKASCEAKGGTWDGTKCIMPKQEAKLTTPEIYRDEETGKITGVTLPNGNSLIGIKPAEVQAIVSKYQQETTLPQGTQPAGTAQQAQEVQQAQVQTFMNEQPENRELSPQTGEQPGLVSKIPVINTMRDILQAVATDKYVDEQGNLSQISPERLRSDALTKIEERVYKNGIDNNSKFGAFIEAIPIAGTLVNQYARGLISTPKGDVNDIRQQITKKKKEITQLTKDAKLSPSIRLQAEDNLSQIEEDIQELESKIKLLINYSAELKANPEQVDLIEQDIFNTKRYLLSARIAIINNQTLASDEDILAGLQQ